MTDLRSRLHDVVDVAGPETRRTAHGATAIDDVIVGALTTRVRRRRAVRAGALGTVGALTVAVLAVGGAAVADRLDLAPVPPATGQPAPDDATDRAAGLTLDCGDRVPEEALRPVDGDVRFAALELGAAQTPAGEQLDVTARLTNDGDATLTWNAEQVLELAALRDGQIVATSTASMGSTTLSPGTTVATTWPITLTPCEADGPLAPGEYELVGSAILANADGTSLVMISLGPVPFTIGAEPAVPADETAAEERVRALVAAERESAASPVGACGTRLPSEPPVPLTLDVTLPVSTYAPGALLEGDAAITARDGVSVLANGPVTSAYVVLVRDGVVVGRAGYDPEHVDLMTFTSEQPYSLPAYGNAVVCATPGTQDPGLALPPGTYQAYGLYPVALKEVQRADGTSESHSDVVTLISEPVDVRIETPAG